MKQVKLVAGNGPYRIYHQRRGGQMSGQPHDDDSFLPTTCRIKAPRAAVFAPFLRGATTSQKKYLRTPSRSHARELLSDNRKRAGAPHRHLVAAAETGSAACLPPIPPSPPFVLSLSLSLRCAAPPSNNYSYGRGMGL